MRESASITVCMRLRKDSPDAILPHFSSQDAKGHARRQAHNERRRNILLCAKTESTHVLILGYWMGLGGLWGANPPRVSFLQTASEEFPLRGSRPQELGGAEPGRTRKGATKSPMTVYFASPASPSIAGKFDRGCTAGIKLHSTRRRWRAPQCCSAHGSARGRSKRRQRECRQGKTRCRSRLALRP